jgi:hypothetical protein
MLSLCSTRTAQLAFSGSYLLVFYMDCSACVLQYGNALLLFYRDFSVSILCLCLPVFSGSAQLMFWKGKLTLCSGSAKLVFYRECYACVLEELVFCKDCSACVLRWYSAYDQQGLLSLCSVGELNLCSERVRPTCVLQGALSLYSQGMLSLCSTGNPQLVPSGIAQFVSYRDSLACVLHGVHCSFLLWSYQIVIYRCLLARSCSIWRILCACLNAQLFHFPIAQRVAQKKTTLGL